ncbi:MAG: type I methionyl aminopeptidase [Nannocystaceae bacterium]|nr:type I methionyl aminopeptidase [Nannocystaceae bacterium]
MVHGPEEREALRRAGETAAATLGVVCKRVEPGITTADIDRWVREDTAARGATPSQLGYKGFPASVCTSVNDVVCHGIPSSQLVLREGDLLNIDVTSCIGGFHGDTSRTLAVGAIDADKRRVTQGAESCLSAGIDAVRPGGRLGDIGAAIAGRAADFGCAVVREYGGHGIGRHMHMPPHVSHVGRAGTGVRLRPGMAFTIEPMLTLTRVPLLLDADDWTVRTADGSPSAQFEHTVVVTESGVEVLTLPPT